MNCQTVRELLLNGESSPLLDEHVAGCEDCRSYRESLHELDTALAGRYTPPELRTAFRTELARSIRRERRRALWNWAPELVPIAAGASATAACALLLPIPAGVVWIAGMSLTAAAYCLQALVSFWFEELEEQ